MRNQPHDKQLTVLILPKKKMIILRGKSSVACVQLEMLADDATSHTSVSTGHQRINHCKQIQMTAHHRKVSHGNTLHNVQRLKTQQRRTQIR